jgi:GTPase SAR1 family protein
MLPGHVVVFVVRSLLSFTRQQDTSGQEHLMHAISPFLSGVSASVMVYNVASAQSLASVRDRWVYTVRKMKDYTNAGMRVVLGTCVLSLLLHTITGII